MGLHRLLLPATALALVLGGSIATAQTPMEDPLDARDVRRVERMEKVVRELRAIVFQGRDTGKPVVIQPAETEYQMQELTRRISDLEETLRRVNGQLETATHELDQSRREGQSLLAQNKTLADRLTVLEQNAAQAQAGLEPPQPAEAAAAGPTAAEAFGRARQLMLNGDYDAAEGAWRDYTGRYADSSKTPEARYWLGKTLTVRGAHGDAAAAYIGAIRGYPQTSWAPDAMIELSRALVALKRPADACQTLTELGRRYPKATVSAKSRAASTSAQAKCA